MPHTNAMAYVMISSLSERSLHITELWAGWDTLEIVTVPECKHQTSQTLVYSFRSQNPVSWCELIGRKAEISAIRAGSAAWHKKPNPMHIYKPTVPKAGTVSLSQMIFAACSAFSSFRVSLWRSALQVALYYSSREGATYGAAWPWQELALAAALLKKESGWAEKSLDIRNAELGEISLSQ